LMLSKRNEGSWNEKIPSIDAGSAPANSHIDLSFFIFSSFICAGILHMTWTRLHAFPNSYKRRAALRGNISSRQLRYKPQWSQTWNKLDAFLNS
jgi:hypothetical protein